jgi:hypothetical protein
LRFALKISPEIHVLHVDIGENGKKLQKDWSRLVEKPTQQAGVPTPQLVVLPSPYRRVLAPIVDYVLEMERSHPQRQVAVIIPELVPRRWYHYWLHNHRATVLKALLLMKGNQHTVVVDVPWYLNS